MYALLKGILFLVLRVPDAPPEIPADGHARVDVYRASPRFLSYQYLGLAVGLTGSFLGFAGVSVALLVSGRPLATVAAVLLGLVWLVKSFFLYAGVRLAYETRYYIVTDKSLRIREGLYTIREVTLTYVNVQNVSIEQGPLERFFGFANVVVETAGGSAPRKGPRGAVGGHAGALLGIANAAEVRDLIRSSLSRVHAQAGLGDSDEPSAAAALGGAELPVLREILAEARVLRSRLGR